MEPELAAGYSLVCSARRGRVRGVVLVAVSAVVAAVAGTHTVWPADDLTTSAETLSALSQRFGVPLVAWLGAGDSVPTAARDAQDLRGAVARIMCESPGIWELHEGTLVLSLPPEWRRTEGIHLPSDLTAMRALIEWIPDEIMGRLMRGETVESAILPNETRDKLRGLVETRFWNDELGPEYLRAVQAGRIGLHFEPFATLLAVAADLMPGEWIAFLSTRGDGARLEVDWSRWAGWAAVSGPPQRVAALPVEAVTLEPGLYDLGEFLKAMSEATGGTIAAAPDCTDRVVYVAVERMPAAVLLRLVAQACCLSVWQDGETILVGNAVPHDDIRCLNQRNLSFLAGLLKPLTTVPSDSEAALMAGALEASPSSRLRDLPEDVQAFVRERCPEPLRPDAEVRLIPGFSLCLYPPGGGEHRRLFY